MPSSNHRNTYFRHTLWLSGIARCTLRCCAPGNLRCFIQGLPPEQTGLAPRSGLRLRPVAEGTQVAMTASLASSCSEMAIFPTGSGSGAPVEIAENRRFRVTARLMNCFSLIGLWLSLLVGLWISRGWIGLLFSGQALSAGAFLVKGLARRTGVAFSFQPFSTPSVRQGNLHRCRGKHSFEIDKNALGGPLSVRYLGDLRIAVSGAHTGILYRFSPIDSVQLVDPRDAMHLLDSGLFGVANLNKPLSTPLLAGAVA